MRRFDGTFRLLPVVLFATASLLALKVVDLAEMRTSRLAIGEVARADTVGPIASDDELLTGSAPKPAEKPAEKPASPQPVAPPQQAQPLPGPSERAILERLQERRQDVEARAKDLETREQLLRAAEKRIEARIGELKELEERVTTAQQKRDDAETQRFRSVVTMYENMKAKDAARIFDRLDMRVLGDVARAMNPRRLGDVLALMSPEAAERLTIELARPPVPSAPAAGGVPAPALPAGELPRIDQKPNS
jgi:flagellar motility protein MotE (MotC chaperone)